ncbi:MAG TPA: replication/maintenance protein RepL [Planococcus sp. (in: firmicutes)]|nr:replication/maintenance protein RepL [Planococcus sp. (in: firmicutes)]
MSARNNIYEARPFKEQKVMKQCFNCFAEEPDRIAEIAQRFTEYFIENATRDGVLFKTIKEITMDMDIPHQTLSKVLKILEKNRVIYRRNGIIGLWED